MVIILLNKLQVAVCTVMVSKFCLQLNRTLLSVDLDVNSDIVKVIVLGVNRHLICVVTSVSLFAFWLCAQHIQAEFSLNTFFIINDVFMTIIIVGNTLEY